MCWKGIRFTSLHRDGALEPTLCRWKAIETGMGPSNGNGSG